MSSAEAADVIEIFSSDDEEDVISIHESENEQEELQQHRQLQQPDVIVLPSDDDEESDSFDGTPYSDDFEVIEVIALLDSDDEDSEGGISQQQSQHQLQQHHLQYQHRHQHQLGQQHQQQQQRPRIVRMYVDGSHRPHADIKMSAGIWVAGKLSIARILQGGSPDSCRAELGTIYAAVDFLSKSGLQRLLGGSSAAAAATSAAAAEVQILTDCQSCLGMLGSSSKVKLKYKELVDAIKRLKAGLPFRCMFGKVKGHSKGADAHAVGNRSAHNLAYRCDKHQPICKLPE